MKPYQSVELLDRLAEGTLRSQDLVQACLDRIAADDETMGAFLATFPGEALEQARQVDEARAAGRKLGALAGIPIAIKDNINIKGHKTTCASRILEDFVSPYDAHVIERLRDAGAIFIGKTNMDEFAMGSSTEYSSRQRTRNPHNPDKVPGGSSGGSTVAVAAGMAPLALGSSTGGSIRQPAAFCGVVGMKPTYGRVSRYGLVAFGSSLDQIGPVANDVEAAARLYQAIAGPDLRDSTCADQALSPFSSLTPLEKPRIGLAKQFMGGNIQPEVKTAMERLCSLLQANGAELVEIDLPHTEYAIPAYYLIATAEASSNLARFDGARYSRRSSKVSNLRDMYVNSRSEGFGPEVKRRILLGTYCLSSGYYEGYYLNAQRVRTKILQDYRQAFTQVDAILAPTTPSTAFSIGERSEDPLAMYLSDIFTVTANLAGIPALSLPAGRDRSGLPIGLQFMCGHFQEERLFRVAKMAENLMADVCHTKIEV